ncbi:hypothetical protein X559_0230 [Paenilisteria newyorkensis]|nr:hypothetical protein X559_0230 [Listeria newyorkensis]
MVFNKHNSYKGQNFHCQLFEDWFHEMTMIENKLKIAFESKTGEAIGAKLMQGRNRLCLDYGQVYREVIQSCKGNHW